MEGSKGARSSSRSKIEDLPWENIFAHLDSADRIVVSEVCQEWKRVDSLCRREVNINSFSSIAPSTLTRRFPHLRSVGIQAYPSLGPPQIQSHANFNPWMAELRRGYRQKINKLYLLRMNVTDADLDKMADTFSDSLVILKLRKCRGGFSTRGLYHITSRCRRLKVLNIDSSRIEASESGDRWLSELALTNHGLEELNFQYVNNCIGGSRWSDLNLNILETLVNNCRSLRSFKVSDDVKFKEMQPFLRRAPALAKLGTGCCMNTEEGDQKPLMTVDFPTSIVALSGLYNIKNIFSICQREVLGRLKSLDFYFPNLDEKDFLHILRHCVGLERLKVDDGLGDDGLIVVAEACKDLKKIIIFHMTDCKISPRGIIPLLQGCVKLEKLSMEVTDVNSATLTAVANHCIFMKECRFVLWDSMQELNDVPLDEGVKNLLIGCKDLYGFGLDVPEGWLTDTGMAYIGMYGSRLKSITLRCTGESDDGLRLLANGCQFLQELYLMDCLVSERGLATAAMSIRTLKYISAYGDDIFNGGGQILARSQSNWLVESDKDNAQLIAHRSVKNILMIDESDN